METCELLNQMMAAREARDYERSDRIREQLISQGFQVRIQGDVATLISNEEIRRKEEDKHWDNEIRQLKATGVAVARRSYLRDEWESEEEREKIRKQYGFTYKPMFKRKRPGG